MIAQAPVANIERIEPKVTFLLLLAVALLTLRDQKRTDLRFEELQPGALSVLVRRALYACGIKQWRGWPTGAGLKRYFHSEAWLRKTLETIGFRVERIVGPNARQKWIVAVKT